MGPRFRQNFVAGLVLYQGTRPAVLWKCGVGSIPFYNPSHSMHVALQGPKWRPCTVPHSTHHLPTHNSTPRLFLQWDNFNLNVNGPYLSCVLRTQSAFITLDAPGTFAANTWAHVACTYSAATRQATLYVGGAAVASATVAFDGGLFLHVGVLCAVRCTCTAWLRPVLRSLSNRLLHVRFHFSSEKTRHRDPLSYGLCLLAGGWPAPGNRGPPRHPVQPGSVQGGRCAGG